MEISSAPKQDGHGNEGNGTDIPFLALSVPVHAGQAEFS